MVIMAAVLLGLGYVIGFAIDPRAGYLGLAVASCIWVIMALVSLSTGDKILLGASRAKPVTKDVHPVLFNVVEEMTIAAGLSKMPKVYIINDRAPNAFATGRKPETSSIAVTAGLLTRLNRDELQGVVAHEMSHIIHRDILYVTVAGVMLGSIVLISHIFLRGMFYGSLGGSSRRYSSGGGGQLQVIMIAVAIIAAILAPLMTYLLYFALSRRREYLADAGGARLTRYPEGLASALEKIASDPSPQLAVANKATAPMYIANPFKRKGQRRLTDLTSTHPPISERIKILRNMSGASFKDYSSSFTRVTGSASVMPMSGLKEKEPIPLRTTAEKPPSEETSQKQQHREAGDLMRKVNGFSFLTCPCGVKLKIPPNFKDPKVKCPRCHRVLDVKSTA